MNRLLMAFFFFWLIFTISCASTSSSSSQSSTNENRGTAEMAEKAFLATDKGKILKVTVNEENVRQYPNGRIIGKLYKNNTLVVERRVGNWVQFSNDNFTDAYIWAPSVGYVYQNLYSPAFYYNAEKKQFFDVEYFQRAFSQKGQRRQDFQSSYELFFKNTGLGSHESIILDSGTSSQQLVEHGITLFVDKKTQKILKIRVDYFRPIRGYQAALKKSELPTKAPITTDSAHLIWTEGELLEKLIIDLERKEWDSEWFSSIWFIMPVK